MWILYTIVGALAIIGALIVALAIIGHFILDAEKPHGPGGIDG